MNGGARFTPSGLERTYPVVPFLLRSGWLVERDGALFWDNEHPERGRVLARLRAEDLGKL